MKYSITPGPVHAAAASVRYWMLLMLDSPGNSTLLREVLGASRDRARDLWAGRVDYTPEELERLCAILQKPLEAFVDYREYLAEQHGFYRAPGDALRGLREIAGLTVDDAALLAHTTPSYLSMAEAGATNFTAGYAGMVTGALGRYIADVASGTTTATEAIEAAREARHREDELEGRENARVVAGRVDAGLTDGDAYRDYIAAACALATTVDITDRIATDPSYPGDRSATADRLRNRMLTDDLDRYRTAQAAFLATVSDDAAITLAPTNTRSVW